jgi:hypothetical protein
MTDNYGTEGQLGVRRMTVDNEVWFLNNMPPEVREYVLYEASINWCAKAVYQLCQLDMDQDAVATIAELKRQEHRDLRMVRARQDLASRAV